MLPRRSVVIVGRADELHLLGEQLAEARAGRGGAVFLSGESGIGKSRLAEPTAEMALESGMRLMRGRASTVGATEPLRPVTQAVLSLLRSLPVEGAALGAYRQILGRIVPEWADPHRAEPASPVMLAESTLRLASIAGRGHGCLLTLDDLQDADAESLVVLEYLLDNLEHQPVLLVGTMLSGETPASDLVHAAARRGRARPVRLKRLSQQATYELVASCLDSPGDQLPPALLDLAWTSTGGHPLLVEELLTELVESGLLLHSAAGWQLRDGARDRLPPSFARHLAAGVDRLSPQARTLLAVAALVGQRFPLAVVQEATGLSDRDLLNHLHNDITSQFVAPDDQVADWYVFRNRLRHEAILAVLNSAQRAELAQAVAQAVQTVYPGLPDEWCYICAELQFAAGNLGEAGRLYAQAGRRALAVGNVDSAVALLDRAWKILDEEDKAQRASTLESLVWALAEAGLVERALASISLLDQVDEVEPRRRIELHTRLAWAAAVAGRHIDAQAHVEAARRLLGSEGDEAITAQIDVVAAHVALDVPGPDQLRRAETLARRAAAVADVLPLPIVSCQAWQLLGSLARHRDPDEATGYLERALSIAVRHQLPIWEVHALIRLGNDDALRDGGLERLELARHRANQTGAVTARYQAEASIALHAILRAEYQRAEKLIDSALHDTRRLRLAETTTYLLLLRAVMAGHRGQRTEMDEAIAEVREEIRRVGGNEAQYTPRIYGLARTFCALLAEDRDLARRELDVALTAEADNPTVYHLTGRFGVDLLLRAGAGDLSWEELESRTASPASRLRWDRLFACFARAIMHGRAGRGNDAEAAVEQAMQVGSPYAMARYLGMRLTAECALADGWGSPIPWLRQAAEYFDGAGVPAVAGACRQLLRQAGARVGQRRPGVSDITESLRRAGVTAREFEVLRLLAGRLSNKEIADRLHLSPRTVERHISSLLQKTGRTNRIELSQLAAEESS